MPKVAIIHKAQTTAALEMARELAGWLKSRDCATGIFPSGARHLGEAPPPEPDLPEDSELIVVLGGDGTMLGAVRAVAEAGLWDAPILGVNLGGLGYLTALSPEELFPAMDKVLAGDYQAPPRMMLRARVDRGGKGFRTLWAMNDVVINKAALAPIIDIVTTADSQPLTTLRADGLIVATPTGSTAYNLSAGGPICHPDLDCILLTPICSFALSNRPLLLSPHITLGVSLTGRRVQYTTVTCDGQVGFELLPDDKIFIQRSAQSVRIVNSPFRDYFEILRTKLRWGGKSH